MAVRKMDSEGKQSIDQLTYRILKESGCGICEKEGGDVYWPNHRSKVAHNQCYLRIKESQAKLIQQIIEMYRYMTRSDMAAAHSRAIRAVRVVCKTPLIVYFEKNGKEEMTKLFDTVGFEAAAKLPTKL